jgi:predicted ATPase
VPQIRQGLDAWRATEAEVGLTWLLGMLAEACGHVGQIKAGLTALAEALAQVDTTGEHLREAELLRFKGELLLQQAVPDASQAETCFHHALDVARRQQAKSWELRTVTSLARLWQHQNKRQAAYDLLAPVYNWFTEGFDTADLQEARVLLEELAC